MDSPAPLPFRSFVVGATLLASPMALWGDPTLMPDVVRRFSADEELFSRHWSAAGATATELEAEKALAQSWQQRLGGLSAKKLTGSDGIDEVLMRITLDSDLNELKRQGEERSELAPWLPFRTVIDEMLDGRVQGATLPPEGAAAKLAPLPGQIRKALDGLKAAKGKTPAKKDAIAIPSAYQAMRCAEICKHQADLLKQWFDNQDTFVPDFSWWVRQPYDETTKALEAYQKHLNEEVAGIKGDDDGPLIGK